MNGIVSGSADLGELADDIRRAFDEMDRALGMPYAAPGECRPTLDVLETDEQVQILVDLPGVPSQAVRVLQSGGTIVVVGQKPRPPDESIDETTAFHLVERVFGRFVRAVRLTAAFDGATTEARLRNGELRIVLSKILDRRGRTRTIDLQT